MGRFNVKRSNRTTNLAGGQAFSMGSEQELVHAVLTTFLNDKYYESGKDRLSRIVSLVQNNKPEFVAKLAIVARKEFYLRSVSHLLLATLSQTHKGDSLVYRAFEEAIMRPDDITEIVSLLGGDLSRQAKKGIRRALYKFNRYQLAKYRAEKNEYKMVDVFNLVHPKPQHATEEQQRAWNDLINGNLKQFDTWENDVKKLPELIMENKLGYMALLRNLNNLIKQDVSNMVIEKAVYTLTDPERVRKSKQLPFRFVKAYENVRGNRRLVDAISEAMDISVGNLPEFDGKTLVAVDVSGSMQGLPIEIASVFAAAIAKKGYDSNIILYDEAVKEFNGWSGRTPVVDIAKMIVDAAMGGGTDTALVFEYAIQNKVKYDRIFILSDNESWREGRGWYTRSPQEAYNVYRKVADPFVYAIDIQGYGTKDVSGDQKKVFHMTGWSDRLLDFASGIEEGQSLIKYIKNIELDVNNRKA